eukprot:gene7007-110_t
MSTEPAGLNLSLDALTSPRVEEIGEAAGGAGGGERAEAGGGERAGGAGAEGGPSPLPPSPRPVPAFLQNRLPVKLPVLPPVQPKYPTETDKDVGTPVDVECYQDDQGTVVVELEGVPIVQIDMAGHSIQGWLILPRSIESKAIAARALGPGLCLQAWRTGYKPRAGRNRAIGLQAIASRLASRLSPPRGWESRLFAPRAGSQAMLQALAGSGRGYSSRLASRLIAPGALEGPGLSFASSVGLQGYSLQGLAFRYSSRLKSGYSLRDGVQAIASQAFAFRAISSGLAPAMDLQGAGVQAIGLQALRLESGAICLQGLEFQANSLQAASQAIASRGLLASRAISLPG